MNDLKKIKSRFVDDKRLEKLVRQSTDEPMEVGIDRLKEVAGGGVGPHDPYGVTPHDPYAVDPHDPY